MLTDAILLLAECFKATNGTVLGHKVTSLGDCGPEFFFEPRDLRSVPGSILGLPSELG